jgi:hypothetical protein
LPNTDQVLDTAELSFSVPDPSFLEATSEQFGDKKSRVKFRDQNTETDEKFDIILAFAPEGNCVDTTRRLLKPNGHVCIVELVHPGKALRTILDSVQWEE